MRLFLCVFQVLAVAATGHAEVLVRWTLDDVPSPQVLGVPALVVPAKNGASVREALAQGYRVYLEVDAGGLAKLTLPKLALAGVVVRGSAAGAQVSALEQRLAQLNVRVFVVDERGKWPHIRSNWVTKNNEVLQVAGRSAQPWIETNAALIRIARAANRDRAPVLSYAWTPLTASDADEGPALENYLVAIAEAGSFGADLVLPLHERFQRRLLLGQPEARRDWNEIRRSLDFYAGNVVARYEPLASIGIVTGAPMIWFEAMNLLARHNVPFEVIAPSQLARRVAVPPLVIVPDEGEQIGAGTLAEWEKKGTVVKGVKEVGDPNKFALEMRQLLGRDRRLIDIWNGITVLAGPYREPGGTSILVTMVNYAHQALPVQLRVAGSFSQVHFESPDEPPALLPHEHRDAHTEFVVPALRVGGRIFLTH
jgi:hypothetical protein